jgi:hypothetical protein
MRKALFAALAATLLSGGMAGNRADAMTSAAPAALGVAAAAATLVQQATNVCGSNGCVRVQTQKVRPPKKHP